MAPITKTLALAGALFALSGVAAPLDKRAVVVKTVTDVVWTTVDVTKTVYPEQPTATHVVDAETTPAVPTTSTSTSTAPAAPAQNTEIWQHSVAKQVEPETTSSTPAPVPEPTVAAPVVPAPEPETSSTSTSTTSSAPAPPPAATSSASSSGGGSSGYRGSCSESSPCTGQLTYYDTAISASSPSACDTTNDGETEFVLALPHGIMTDSDCGKSVTINYNGVTQKGKVVDKCMGCGDTSIDLSRALFGALAPMTAGRIHGATWYIE